MFPPLSFLSALGPIFLRKTSEKEIYSWAKPEPETVLTLAEKGLVSHRQTAH